MTDNCKNKCCNLYNDIDEEDDQYIIERLEDIVEISNFLINVLKHKKMKKETFDSIMKESEKKVEEETEEETEEKSEEKTEEIDYLIERIIKELKKETLYSKYYKYPYYYARFNPSDVIF